MHIEFKRIILHNFMSFGDADLRFSDDGFVRVSGINENPMDNAGSNGSGKSSLWEALIWVITGETIRGTKQIVNLHGEDGCFVDIEFYVDKTRYQLIRSKDHKIRKTNLQILINGEDCSGKGVRDSQALLQQYLPDLTASLLGSVIVLGQGLPQKFTNNTPSGRKEVLEKLSKSDFMIEDLKNRVADRRATLTKDQRAIEDTVLQLETEKTILNNIIVEAQNALSNLDEKSLLEERNSAVSMLTSIERQLLELQPEYDSIQSRILDLKSEESTLLASQTNDLNQQRLEYDAKCLDPLKNLNELKATLHVYQSELTRIRNIKDVCPTCGQRITTVHKPDTSKLEENIASTVEQVQHLQEVVDKCQQDYEERIKQIQEKYRGSKLNISDELLSLSRTQSAVKTSISTYEAEKSKIKDTVAKLEQQLAQLQTNLELNTKIITDNSAKLVEIDNLILYNNAQKDLTRSHLDVISKFDTALKRDFRGYLLSTVINFIETKAKQYCKIIFDTTDISFCLNGNNIDISYMNKAYENLSGGEKQKVDLIIQFSIRDMLSSHLNFTSNVLVLDEVFDGLDTIGCNRVIDMINKLSDVKNVFIVTHRKDLSIPTDRELIVVKSSVGISEIRR